MFQNEFEDEINFFYYSKTSILWVIYVYIDSFLKGHTFYSKKQITCL